jgi:hypothetical protein
MKIPIFRELRAVIDASETGDLTCLVIDRPYGGKQKRYSGPYTVDEFGNLFRDAVTAARLGGIPLTDCVKPLLLNRRRKRVQHRR